MFGSHARKARKTAIEAVSPFIRIFERTSGIPKGFWEDEYVLGFLNGAIGTFAKMGANNKLSGGDLGQVIIDVFGDISGKNKLEIAQRIINYQQQMNLDFLKGMENSQKVIIFTFDPSSFNNDADVLKAKKLAKNMPQSLKNIVGSVSSDAETAGVLQELLFFDIVRERLQ